MTRDAPMRRLQYLATLDDAAVTALRTGCERPRKVHRFQRLFDEGATASSAMIVSGWAARSRITSTGSRQILSVVLPGEIVHPIDHGSAPLVALTPIEVCAAPSSDATPSLKSAYRISRQLNESYLLAQVARLGGMRAEQRVSHFIAELYERLLLSGETIGNSFSMPLSQATFADAVGITPVHANRMVQAARSSGELSWEKGLITLAPGSAILERARRNVAGLKRGDAFVDRT